MKNISFNPLPKIGNIFDIVKFLYEEINNISKLAKIIKMKTKLTPEIAFNPNLFTTTAGIIKNRSRNTSGD